jgi:site-specific DNA-methyltransferase (adenine-specific)
MIQNMKNGLTPGFQKLLGSLKKMLQFIFVQTGDRLTPFIIPQKNILKFRRGSKSNWKNCIEDIWFCTPSDKYTFNINDVKIKRKVIAPYKTIDGKPKDWEGNGKDNFRITYPSNIWTDITIPFWSMPENTEHPTQKPEKLLAKIILASSNKGDFVFDPFAGSGTTLVAAKKLGRNFLGVEIDEYYSCLAQKRIQLAEEDSSIQGYSDGIFWERNTFQNQSQKSAAKYQKKT